MEQLTFADLMISRAESYATADIDALYAAAYEAGEGVDYDELEYIESALDADRRYIPLDW